MTASISTALGNQAAPITMEWRGRTLEFRELQWNSIVSALEQWLIDRAIVQKIAAWEALHRKGLMTLEQVQQKAEEFTDQCVEHGLYSFGSPAMMAIFNDVAQGSVSATQKRPHFAGVLKLVSLMTALSEDDVISLMNEKGTELGMKLALTMNRGLPPDPKSEGA